MPHCSEKSFHMLANVVLKISQGDQLKEKEVKTRGET